MSGDRMRLGNISPYLLFDVMRAISLEDAAETESLPGNLKESLGIWKELNEKIGRLTARLGPHAPDRELTRRLTGFVNVHRKQVALRLARLTADGRA
ncbi:MAG: hypothetical protein LBW85_01410 [Deltaproteobacteria bacterium]|jgi:hypothetical protein|nr:hypothetical protein [Deltaproteobacteria bacterium]